MNGRKHLIVIGEKHKTGQHDDSVDYFMNVEDYAKGRFSVDRIEFRWSAQHYRPANQLPYIGKAASSDDLYIATGFGTDGLTYGSLAARLITDDILGRENPWAGLYNARRFAPAKSASDFLKENINVAAQYAKDYLTKAGISKAEDIKPNEGGLLKSNDRRIAAYRDDAGRLIEHSAVCTHLGCIVHWNRMEGTWDCPCHGSRFNRDGKVLEGPALHRLRKK